MYKLISLINLNNKDYFLYQVKSQLKGKERSKSQVYYCDLFYVTYFNLKTHCTEKNS